MKKFVALFDMHFGYETVITKGIKKTRTTHNLHSIKCAIAFCRHYKPDVVILGGDQLNCGPISHWNKGKPRLSAHFRLKEEYDLLIKHVLLPLESMKLKEKIWLEGNHEVWIKLFLDENPGLEGLLEPEEYLQLKSRGWQVYSQGEHYSLGKLFFVHGDVVLGKGYRVNPAKLLVDKYRRNIRAGHLHTWGAAIEETPIDVQDYHSGIIVPSLSMLNLSYGKNAPNNCVNGFLFGEVGDNGYFNDHVMIVHRGECLYNGEKIRAAS